MIAQKEVVAESPVATPAVTSAAGERGRGWARWRSRWQRRIVRWMGAPAVALGLAGCVTINIYFPAAAAEEAAREIVRDVLQLDGAREGAPDDGAAPSAAPAGTQTDASGAIPAPAPSGRPSWGLTLVAAALDRVVAPAAAQAPNIRIETPATQRLRAAMRARDAELRPFYQSGAIGFDNNGDVAVRDLSAVPLRDRQTVQRLVAEENADRAALYRELARANERPDWEAQIRATFARVWIDEAPAGYWVQDRGGQWTRK